ncbi:lipopolysaccharide biosynthesis protein [Uliginosibacterium aquaticum]|uniref:Lipopolysaccharide biosynthesis protein n=1 Tax=Uliginosibacterium aquaticum TaxID=2731212 RepID=A0ABX2ICB8_9RHOO|nr:lipopolysaccharide biosynthesis protein [Uliginosibacterium aquaticum]NSL54036.1 lipopolysaccharide biosynthesis protein [Uliginosibacterium aquaticum]
MLIRRTLQTLPAQLLSPLAQFASVLIWTHIASSDTIGAATLITGQQELVRALFLGWWSQYALRFVGEQGAAIERFASTSVRVLAVSAVAQMVFALCLLVWLVSAQPSGLLVLGTAAFVALRGINQHQATVAAALGRALDYNVLSLCGPVLGLGLGCAMLLAYGDNPAFPVLGYAAGEALGGVYSLRRASWVGVDNGFDRPILRQAFEYGAPLLLSGVLAWLAVNLTRYLVDYRLGLAAAGQFAVGFGLGQRAAAIAAMLVTAAALPMAIRRMQESGLERSMQQLADNCALLLAVMLPSLLGLHLVSPDLIRLAVSSDFQQSTQAILPWALISGGMFAFIYNYLNHYFLVTVRPRPLVLVDVSLVVLTFALFFPCMALWGLSGGVVAMALAASGVAGAMLFYLVGRRELQFPTAHCLKVSACCAVMAGAILIKPVLAERLLNLAGNIMVGGLAYVLAMMLAYHRMLRSMLQQRRAPARS